VLAKAESLKTDDLPKDTPPKRLRKIDGRGIWSDGAKKFSLAIDRSHSKNRNHDDNDRYRRKKCERR